MSAALPTARESRTAARRLVGVLLAAALLLLSLPGLPTAHADTSPPASSKLPATVSADPLPTWQLTGVVWSQVLVGNTVYATGAFTRARPPGMRQGGPTEIAVSNLFAYDIRTGERVASFDHSLNAQGLAITASPDGSEIFVGGDFTAVDDQARQHVAAFDAATGALLANWAPAVNGEVKALTATKDTLYVGGTFENAGGVPRRRLAAVSNATGDLLPWAPTADDNDVLALTMTPDGSKVIVGGQFPTLNGAVVNGMGALNPVTGATLPWAANSVIKDYDHGGIGSLTTDGAYIYGSGWAYGAGGTFEGSFSLNPVDGSIRWMVDCLGDTYDVQPIDKVVYTVSHSHNCTMVGGFPDTSPRVRWQRAGAYTSYPTGVNNGPDAYGWNYKNQPAPTMLHWYPNLEIGTASGQSQAAWSVVGNSDYVALGGEFPTVNGTEQFGLTRFAVPSVAPDKVGPQYDTVPARSVPPTTATPAGPGAVRVTFGSAWDKDNQNLTYAVYRDKNTVSEKLVKTVTSASNFWTLPTLSVTDNAAPAGTHSYAVRITDPDGNELVSPTSGTATATGAVNAYGAKALADGADHLWRLDEPHGATTAYDAAGSADAAVPSGVALGTTGAVVGSSDTAASFNGTSGGILGAGAAATPVPATFTEEAWFKTTTTRGGKIIGYGSAKTGASTSYDRHVYLDNSGHVLFGVSSGGAKVLRTPAAFNDGAWHLVDASLSSDGMALFVDGRLIARDRTVTGGVSYTGYWRIAGDNLGGWPSAPTSGCLAGSLDEVATYPTALTAAQVNAHFVQSGRTSTAVTKAPADAYGVAVYNAGPQLYWRLEEAAGPVAQDATRNDNRGLYSGTPTYRVTGALTTTTEKAVTMGSNAASVSSASNFPALATYTEELWFKTTTTVGGKLIDFGSAASGLSPSVDRSLTITNTGKLRFATAGPTGAQVAVDTVSSYNNNRWHHAVASQSSQGMRLYVDGVQVASSPSAATTSFPGYWRVGYDKVWSGSTSSAFAGSIDEVAVYNRVLSLSETQAHYRAGGGSVAALPPVARITSSGSGLKQTFSGTGSSDADGTVTGYAWNFGDSSAKVTTATATHTYARAGTYSVTLTVTDNNAGTNTVTKSVTVADLPPVAGFTPSASGLKVAFDGTGSSDPDGAVAAYAWNFGDGSPGGTGSRASHTYTAAGSYAVTLTVTDDHGTSSSVTTTVTVTNMAPTALFTSSADNLVRSFDGTGSSDPDGTIASYTWDFGDGSHGTGATATHIYAEPGTYPVSLTVTDDRDGTDSVTHPVTITGPVAQDTFNRTLASGWGAADVGGTWTLTGSSSQFAVANGIGTIQLTTAGSGPSATLNASSSTDTDLQLQFAFDQAPTGGGEYVSAIVRGDATNGYHEKVLISSSGAMTVFLCEVVGGTETELGSQTVPGTFAVGQPYSIRVQAWGTAPTNLRAKLWRAGTTEPDNWSVSANDSTNALQVPGGLGVWPSLSASSTTGTPVVVSISHLVARPAGN